MAKPLLAFFLGLVTFIGGIVVFLATGKIETVALIVMSLSYFLCGRRVARGNEGTLWKDWGSMLVLNWANLVLLAMVIFRMVAQGAGASAIQMFAVLAVTAWGATCAGVYVASRPTRHTSAAITLTVVALPLAAFCAPTLVAYCVGRFAGPVQIDGVSCVAGSVSRQANRRLEECVLSAEATVSNLRLPPGTSILLLPSGRLRSATLGGAVTIAAGALPTGTVVFPTAEGRITSAFLAKDMEIQGHLCRGSADNWRTEFHPDGSLAGAWLGRDEVIQGIPCGRATFLGELTGARSMMTKFHPDGALQTCRIARDITVRGVAFKQGEHIDVDIQGRVFNYERQTHR